MAEKCEAGSSCCLFRGLQKLWIEYKLMLWHPLEVHWGLLLGLGAIAFLGFYALFFEFGEVSLSQIQVTVFNVCFSVVLAIIVFYSTLLEIKRLEYADALKKLLIELGMNKDRLDNFISEIDVIFSKYESEKKWNWVKKYPSYTNWASGDNFQFKYFPSSAYFNFVNKGYILDDKYLKVPKGNIASVYESVQSFNTDLQKLENIYHKINWDAVKDEHDNQKSFCVSFDFYNITYCFQNIDEINTFLKGDFINFYRYKHVNGGIDSNYTEVKNELIEYYDFEVKIRKDKAKEKRVSTG